MRVRIGGILRPGGLGFERKRIGKELIKEVVSFR